MGEYKNPNEIKPFSTRVSAHNMNEQAVQAPAVQTVAAQTATLGLGAPYHCRLENTAKVLVAGASGQGKSTLVADSLIRHRDLFLRPIKACYLFFKHENQAAYERLKNELDVPIYFIRDPPTDAFAPERDSVVVFDDLLQHDSEVIRSFFLRKSHHLGVAVIYLIQNLFSQNKTTREISLNSTHIVLFRPRRDFSQIERLNYQLNGSGHAGFLTNVYKAMGSRPHAYLLVDVSEDCPPAYKYRSTLVPQPGVTLVFQPGR